MKAKAYTLIINLSTHFSDFYLPDVCVGEINDEGFPTYAVQKVRKMKVGAYKIELNERWEKVFALVEMLSVEQIETKFNNRSNRKKKSIEQLLLEETIKKTIIKWVQNRLIKLLKIIIENDFLLAVDLMRKDWIANKQILFGTEKLKPNLYFKKTEKGIYYQLKLARNEALFSIENKIIYILSNEPAWVIIGDELFKIEAINGNLLKPFIDKQKVFIPQNFVKTYFQKFIVKIAAKTDIETEGFLVENFETITKCELRLTKDFLSNRFGFIISFFYNNVKFDFKEQKQLKTHLSFNENDIQIQKYIRDETAELDFIQKLKNIGLANRQGKYLELETTEKLANEIVENYELYNWLIKHQTELLEQGFTILSPEIEYKKMYLAKAKLTVNLTQINDWFDIKGAVQIGEFSIPFQRILPIIKLGNHFFQLPNGDYFLIPIEWFEKYRSIAQLAKMDTKTIRLAKSQFTVIKDLGIEYEEKSTNVLNENYKNTTFLISEKIKATLRPYQLEGVKWLVNLQQNKFGGCLADDMGLGKTLQTITALQYAKEQKAEQIKNQTIDKAAIQLDFFQQLHATTNSVPLVALIVLPASLIFNWEAELRKFAPHLMIHKHIGAKRYKNERFFPTFDIVLTTYQTAQKDIEILKKVNFEYIILDESQQIKNHNSKIFKALSQLKAKNKLSLSGTPIENSLADLWSQMEFINPELLGTYKFFKENFQNPIEKGNDEAKKQQLRTLTAPYILRRTKSAVAKDLPPLTEQIFYSEMLPEQKKLYEKAKSQARNYLLDKETKQQENYHFLVFATLIKLRQLAIHPNLVKDGKPSNSGKFEDILEQLNVIKKGGHKVLIFSQFVAHLDIFKSYFKNQNWNFVLLTGKMKLAERHKSVQEFEENEATQFFLISLKAGGTGLNLTAADYVFITDPWWNPAIENQAIARAHRIGQTKNVIATKFITKDTIEEKILQLQQKKQQLADDIISDDNKFSFSSQDLEFLLK
jgi:non-specific serine/threonine protein kinase